MRVTAPSVSRPSTCSRTPITLRPSCDSLRAGQELRPERAAIDLRAFQVDLIDLVRVGDPLEGIGVEHDEVGFLAGSHRAHPSQSENPGVHGGCCLYEY